MESGIISTTMTTQDLIQDLVKELKELQAVADAFSRATTEDGREISVLEKARADGSSAAYSLCIMRLKNFAFV